MRRALAIVVLAAALAGCGVVSLFSDGLKYVKATEAELERVIGVKPQVGFNWNNGKLRLVTVTFPSLYEAKPLGELAATVRSVVVKEFKEAPDSIVLAFSLAK